MKKFIGLLIISVFWICASFAMGGAEEDLEYRERLKKSRLGTYLLSGQYKEALTYCEGKKRALSQEAKRERNDEKALISSYFDKVHTMLQSMLDSGLNFFESNPLTTYRTLLGKLDMYLSKYTPLEEPSKTLTIIIEEE
ncbi:MAG: hypothetical protein JSS34_07695 [Proteobacteria bacterium]|nr:hypothetical protein [Pseudomonadota bacterium]